MTLSIENAKWPDFKKYFLMTYPNQTKNAANALSDDEWVFYRIFLFARGAYEKGFNQEFAEQNIPPIDKDIIKQV